MPIPLYLAMTAAEASACVYPEKMAYMACHFSSYGLGLSNLPSALPPDALLILNDRIPIWEHDQGLIAQQLTQIVEAFACSGVVLDLQRPGDAKAAALATALADGLPCPVGVSEYYAKALSCPVFLSAPPPDRSLENHIKPWQGRDIWLEAALETIQITVTETGSSVISLPPADPEAPFHEDTQLCCRYHTKVFRDRAVFTISRTWQDLAALLEQATALGISRAVGLYQQLNQQIKNPAD